MMTFVGWIRFNSFAFCCELNFMVSGAYAAIAALRKLQTRTARGDLGRIRLALPPDVAGWMIERERATRFGGVPTIVSRILDSGANERHDFSSITRISYGGAPASPALVDRIADAFPNLKNRVINGYGLTECSPLITLNTGPDYLDHPDSVGVPVPTVEISIRDDSGQPVSKGETGEIWVKGSNVIDGYWQRPEINAETTM